MLPHPDQRYGHLTYAQHGDDIMILNIFDLLGMKKFSYLDIGAHHPSHISNTRLAYERGCRGMNVDANAQLEAAFKEDRPFDINLFGIAVGAEDGVAKFYKFSATSGRNTLSEIEVQNADHGLSVKETVEVPVVSINRIVPQYFNNVWPDLLLIDAEGMDYDILKIADFKFLEGPMVICVETRQSETLKMVQLMARKHYTIFSRMGENLFFIRGDLYKKAIGYAME